MTTATAQVLPASGGGRVRRSLPVVGAVVATSLYVGTLAVAVLAVPGDDGVDVAEAAFLFALLLFALVGAVVAWHRPGNPVGWLLLAAGLGVLLSAALDEFAHYALVAVPAVVPSGVWARWAQNWLFTLAWGVGTTLPLLLFPDGRLPSPRWRWVMNGACAVVVVETVTVAVMPGPIGTTLPVDNPLGIGSLGPQLSALAALTAWAMSAVTLLALAALVLRWRRSVGQARRRLAWLAFGALLTLGLVALDLLASAVGIRVPDPVGVAFMSMALAVLPISVAIAILREQLFDIEVVFSRTLVYAGLTAIVALTYATSLAVASRWLNDRADVAASLIATALVAVGLGSVKERLRRRTERALFGDRSRPYAVLASLGAAAGELAGTAAILPAMADLIRQTLKLPYVAVRLAPDTIVAQAGAPTEEVESFPMAGHDRNQGCLLVGRRSPTEQFSAAEHALLADAARQVSVAATAVRLADDLHASQRRLVRARAQERARIRRDLHDGLGPILGAATLQIDTLRTHVDPHDSEGRQLADRIKSELRQAMSDVRRLIDGLRPAVLNDHGLHAALDEQALALRDSGVAVQVECPDDLEIAGSAAEVAAYRIAAEALTNVARHAHAAEVQIKVQLRDGTLSLTVHDDGRGLPDGPHRPDGLGLASMRERATELGGTCRITNRPEHGTTVDARIPLEAGR